MCVSDDKRWIVGGGLLSSWYSKNEVCLLYCASRRSVWNTGLPAVGPGTSYRPTRETCHSVTGDMTAWLRPNRVLLATFPQNPSKRTQSHPKISPKISPHVVSCLYRCHDKWRQLDGIGFRWRFLDESAERLHLPCALCALVDSEGGKQTGNYSGGFAEWMYRHRHQWRWPQV